MAVRIRLARGGKKRNPVYKVVVANSESPRDGKFLEKLGIYDPNHETPIINIDEEKTTKWLKVGAIPTETVNALLKKAGIIEPSQKTTEKETPKKAEA